MFYILFFQISFVGENARAALGCQYRRLGADRAGVRPLLCRHPGIQYSPKLNSRSLLKPRCGFGSATHSFLSAGSALEMRIRIQEGKITHRREEISSFFRAGCSLLKDEVFSRTLYVFYGGLGISKLQFLIKKYKSCCKLIFSIFCQ
jgi:hypothetical protein